MEGHLLGSPITEASVLLIIAVLSHVLCELLFSGSQSSGRRVKGVLVIMRIFLFLLAIALILEMLLLAINWRILTLIFVFVTVDYLTDRALGDVWIWVVLFILGLMFSPAARLIPGFASQTRRNALKKSNQEDPLFQHSGRSPSA